jgi:hypothetical protein
MLLAKRIALTAAHLFRVGDGPERVVTYAAPVITWALLEGASDGKRAAFSIFVFTLLLVITLCWKEVGRKYSEPRLIFQRQITPIRTRYQLMADPTVRLASAQLYLRNQPDIRTERAIAKGACVSVTVYDPQNVVGHHQDSFSICPWTDNVTNDRFDQRTLDLSPNGIQYGFYLLLIGSGHVYVARPNDFSSDGATTHPKQELPKGTYLVRLEALAENMEDRPSKWFRIMVGTEHVEVASMILDLNLDNPFDRELWLSFDGDLKNCSWNINESRRAESGQETGAIGERTPAPAPY